MLSIKKRNFESINSEESIMKKCEYFKKLINELLYNLIDFTFELNNNCYCYCSSCNKFSYTIDQNKFIIKHEREKIINDNYKIVIGTCELCFKDIEFTYGLTIKSNFYYKNLDNLNKRKASSKNSLIKLCKVANNYLIAFNFDFISNNYCLYCKRHYWLDSQDDYKNISGYCKTCSNYLKYIKKKDDITKKESNDKLNKF